MIFSSPIFNLRPLPLSGLEYTRTAQTNSNVPTTSSVHCGPLNPFPPLNAASDKPIMVSSVRLESVVVDHDQHATLGGSNHHLGELFPDLATEEEDYR